MLNEARPALQHTHNFGRQVVLPKHAIPPLVKILELQPCLPSCRVRGQVAIAVTDEDLAVYPEDTSTLYLAKISSPGTDVHSLSQKEISDHQSKIWQAVRCEAMQIRSYTKTPPPRLLIRLLPVCSSLRSHRVRSSPVPVPLQHTPGPLSPIHSRPLSSGYEAAPRRSRCHASGASRVAEQAQLGPLATNSGPTSSNP